MAGAVITACIGNYAGLTKDSWPGWVQAIGSIAALGVAIFVMGQQNKHAAKLLLESDKRALLRRVSSVEVLLARALEQVKSCAEVLPSVANIGSVELLSTAKNTMIHNISEARRVLLIVPAHELGSYEMTTGMQDMIDCLGHLERTIDSWALADIYDLAPNYDLVLDQHYQTAKDAHNVFKRGAELLS